MILKPHALDLPGENERNESPDQRASSHTQREPRRRGAHRRPNRSPYCLLVELLSGWGVTLRFALVLLVLLLVLGGLATLIILAFGAEGAIMLASLCVALERMWHRRNRPSAG